MGVAIFQKKDPMLYLNDTTYAQRVVLPRNTEASGAISMRLVSTIDHTSEVFPSVIDLAVLTRFYVVAISLPSGTQQGEYEYELSQGGKVVSSGLVIIGMTPTRPTEYNQVITYEQYETTD